MLPAQKIAEDGVVRQCRGRRPDANTAIDQRVLMHFGAGAEQRERYGDERLLEQQDQKPERKALTRARPKWCMS